MSKNVFTMSEQKQKVISFIKKHKDILGVTEKVKDIKDITDEYLDKLKNASNKEFFRLASKVSLKFGSNFGIFSDNCDEKQPTITIWLPVALFKITSDNAIKELCGSNSFENVIETRGVWLNMTPKRWEAFEAIFDYYEKPKKTAKKAKKIVNR